MDDQQRAPRYRDLFAARREDPGNCAYCPICTTIGIVRDARPELLDHLASATREILAAAAILVEEAESVLRGTEGAEPHGPEEGPGRADNLHRIV